MDVSVLVVTWNSARDIAACLDAALAQEGVDLEVIVVDNASADDTREVLAGFAADPRVTVLLQAANLGYAEGNNVAARQARGRHLLLLNPDCEMASGCATTLTAHLDTAPGSGAAAAMLRYADGSPQSFMRRDASFGVTLWAFLEIGKRLDGWFFQGRHQAHRIYAEFDGVTLTAPLPVDCPAAACVLVPRSLAGQQLFDPRLPLFFNDAELYRRLRDRGYAVEVVPGANAMHHYGASVAELPSSRRRAEMIAALRQYVAPAWSTGAVTALWVLLALDAFVCFVLPRTRPLARGTLGGLGLPGGDAPWLTTFPPRSRRLRQTWRRVKGSGRRRLTALSRRTRRLRFLGLAKGGAWISGCRLTLDVSKTADLPRRVRFEFVPGSEVTLHLGRRALVRPDLVLRLGGELYIGPLCELRQGVVLNVKGRLVLTGRNVLGRGAMVHADELMLWEWGATTGEYVSVLDSSHVLDRSLVHVFDQAVTSRPVVIGASSLLGGHSVVLPGCRIGRAAIVGSGSVVTCDVADGSTVTGVPARVLQARQVPPAGRRRAADSRR